MDYKVLYRKYRPSNFSDIVGQEYTIKMLQNAIIHHKISHAYLFTGPRGTGKTSTAKIFAKTINCLNIENGEACGKCEACLSFSQSPDIIEIDAASNNGVDDIRELRNNVKIAPTENKYKVYIIDEVHMLSTSAFNALLLTLEEPPTHAIFILATTNVESVPITILSRCQRFNFKKFSIEELEKQISFICKEEKIKITDEACTEIAYLSEGGMRDALSLVDQLASNEEEITLDKIFANYGSVSLLFIKNIIKLLENKNVSAISDALEELQNTTSDYKIFIKKLIHELSFLAVQIKNEKYPGSLTYNQIKKLILELNECMNQININTNPFELILIILLDTIPIEDIKVEINNKKNFMEQKVENTTNLNEEADFKEEDNSWEEYIKNLRQIRVNNCFVNAKKEFLIKNQEIWSNLKDNLNILPDIKSLIMDSNIVASSETYCILTAKLASTVNLINKKLADLIKETQQDFDDVKKFICLTEEEWNKEKKTYVENIKNGQKYVMISEEELIENMLKREEESEITTTNVFNRDKIEII